MKLMKVNKISCLLISLMTIIVSCSKSSCEEIRNENYTQEEDLEKFAEVLSRAVNHEAGLREFIKQEALLEFDNDNDLLVHYVFDKQVGESTFGEILGKYDIEGLLNGILERVPLLTILVPDWSWISDDCFSVYEWDTSTSDVRVNFQSSSNLNNLYYEGELETVMPSGYFPSFPVLVVKVNERMEVRRIATKGGIAFEYEFADPAFDGMTKTRGQTIYHDYDVDTDYIEPDNYVFIQSLEQRLIQGYQTLWNNQYVSQREYLYYGMTNPTDTGRLNIRYKESIAALRFEQDMVSGLFDDTQKIQGTQQDVNDSDYNLGNGSGLSNSDIINLSWSEGKIELCIVVLTGGEEAEIRMKSLSLKDAFYVKQVHQEIHLNWLRAVKSRTYYFTAEDLVPKWFSLQQDARILFNWDGGKSIPIYYKLKFYEKDRGVQNNRVFTHSWTHALNITANYENGEPEIYKTGAGYTGTYSRQRSTSYSYSDENDDLGMVTIHYTDPIVKSVSGNKAEIKVYSTGSIAVMIVPVYE